MCQRRSWPSARAPRVWATETGGTSDAHVEGPEPPKVCYTFHDFALRQTSLAKSVSQVDVFSGAMTGSTFSCSTAPFSDFFSPHTWKEQLAERCPSCSTSSACWWRTGGYDSAGIIVVPQVFLDPSVNDQMSTCVHCWFTFGHAHKSTIEPRP